MIRQAVLVAAALAASAVSAAAQGQAQGPPRQAAPPAAVTPQSTSPAQDTSSLGPQEIGTIRFGQTRNGLLEEGDWVMGDGTWTDIWYVEVAAGQRLVAELRTRGQRRFDAYLQLLDPWGNMLAEDDDSAGNGDARITYTARDAGRYQIVVNSFGDTPQTGPYTLAVR